MDILDYVKDEIRAERAYKIEHMRVPVKLDANECNLPLPDGLQDEIVRAIGRLPLNRYPSGHSDRLRDALSLKLGVLPSQIVVGNGSNEVIQILLTTFSRRLDPASAPVLVIPTPTFGMYSIIAANQGMRVAAVPLPADFSLDPDEILDAVRRERASAILLAYPNNPTGNCFSEAAIEAILAGFSGLVVVDEAYQPFSGRSFLGRLAETPNLVLLRTFSKIGFAGLRIGYAVASERVAAELSKVRLPFGVNVYSETAALVALSNSDAIETLATIVREERERMAPALAKIGGIRPFPSLANFILFRTEVDADRVQTELLARGISVRNFNRGGTLANCLRVTIGTVQENDRFLADVAQTGARLRG